MSFLDDLLRGQFRSAYWNTYYATNKERILGYHKNDYLSLNGDLKILLGCRCAWCCSDDFEFLEIDHIHNDGAEQRRRFNNNAKSEWRYYRNHPTEAKQVLQLLCQRCHKKKTKSGTRKGKAPSLLA